MRAALPVPDDFEIVPELMTKEPLAQLVRPDDVQFFSILRWTIFAAALLLLIGTGIAKIVIALGRGRTNVGFLIGLIIVDVVSAAWVSFPRLTSAGKNLLADAQAVLRLKARLSGAVRAQDES